MSKLTSIYDKKRLLFNTILSIVQVLVLGGTYFILYTILLKTLGSQKLGTWSVVLSTSSIANVANIGLSSSLVRYIASYKIERDSHKINNLIKTGVILISLFVGIVCLILYFVGFYALPIFLPISELNVARELLPFSLLSLWISSLGGIFLSTIDGLHTSSLRSVIYITSALFFILIGWQLLQNYGLIGIAIAQIIQALLLLFLSIFGVKLIFKDFNLFPLCWDKNTFNQIYKFSADFQIIGFCQLLYDPITKFFLSKYGGLSFVGYYEMANRLIVQIRTLIVAANQVMVPSIASNSVNNRDESYSKTLELVTMVSFPIIVAVLVFTPYISYYWIGQYEYHFIWSSIILSISWFINMLTTPSYFSSMGLGDLKGILQSHIFIAISNIVLGLLLGHYFGGIGIVLSWGLSLGIGSLISTLYYNKNYKIDENSVDIKRLFKIALSSVLCLVFSFILFKICFKNAPPHKVLLYTTTLYMIYILSLFYSYLEYFKIYYLKYPKKNNN